MAIADFAISQLAARLGNSRAQEFASRGQSLTVNGASANRSWLLESFITNGGTLGYTLGTTPNTSWGSADAPPSFDAP